MPHIIVEHTRWINNSLPISGLLDALLDEAKQIEALPVGGLRIRSVPRKKARIGDGDSANQFIYIMVRIGRGRSDDVKKTLATACLRC